MNPLEMAANQKPHGQADTCRHKDFQPQFPSSIADLLWRAGTGSLIGSYAICKPRLHFAGHSLQRPNQFFATAFIRDQYRSGIAAAGAFFKAATQRGRHFAYRPVYASGIACGDEDGGAFSGQLFHTRRNALRHYDPDAFGSLGAINPVRPEFSRVT